MFLISYSCNNDEQKVEDTSSFSKTFYKPSGVISIERASTLEANWLKGKNTALRKGSIDAEDNRSCSWSLEDIRNYLDYAENESEKMGYSMNGVRIYFARYPENEGGLATMFWVPIGTKNASDNKNTSSKTSKSSANGNKDLPINPLNDGGHGNPPRSGYPQ